MADFCHQCSMEMFGQDFHDLAGFVSYGHKGKVLCEGCGFTWVDHEGRCVSADCLRKHGAPATALEPDPGARSGERR